jgi:hypothetical protein
MTVAKSKEVKTGWSVRDTLPGIDKSGRIFKEKYGSKRAAATAADDDDK